MKVVSLLVGVSLMIELGILPCPANGLEFTGICLDQDNGEKVILKETTFTPWAEAELKLANQQRTELLSYNNTKQLVHNPRISQYADWHNDRICENIKLHYGESPAINFTNKEESRQYWIKVLPTEFKMTGCNLEYMHYLGDGWKAYYDSNNALDIYNGFYKNNLLSRNNTRIGIGLFGQTIKEVGFSRKVYSKNIRVVTIMSWPPLFTNNFKGEDLVPKCILDKENKSVTNDKIGSSDAWRLRFLTRVNQHRVKDNLSELLLNNKLCDSVMWSLVELNSLKDKSVLKTNTTQGIIDATGKTGWKVQCKDTLLEHNGKGDSNNELDAIEFVDSLYAKKADPLHKQLFSKDAKEGCATVDTIETPQTKGGNGKWAVGVMLLSKEEKGLNGGTTEIPAYVEERVVEENGVGSHILNLWMISFGVNCLKLFFTFFSSESTISIY